MAERPMRPDRESGQITAFMVVISVALILVSGLALDGGQVFAARVRVLADAQEAARMGAQQLDLVAWRDRGVLLLEPAKARSAAAQFAGAAGGSASVHATTASVTVTLRRSQSLSLLGLLGIGPLEVRAHAEAHPVRGITTILP